MSQTKFKHPWYSCLFEPFFRGGGGMVCCVVLYGNHHEMSFSLSNFETSVYKEEITKEKKTVKWTWRLCISQTAVHQIDKYVQKSTYPVWCNAQNSCVLIIYVCLIPAFSQVVINVHIWLVKSISSSATIIGIRFSEDSKITVVLSWSFKLNQPFQCSVDFLFNFCFIHCVLADSCVLQLDCHWFFFKSVFTI